MNTAQPIKKSQDLINLKNYYKIEKPNPRNYLLIITGLNTALRISDILALRWDTVYDFKRDTYKSHINIIEQKTGKRSQIFINQNILEALVEYRQYLLDNGDSIRPEDYLFTHSNKNVPITRVQAFRLIKDAAEDCGITGVISCHSLRKTFGYHAWQQGTSLALLVNIYNHSSYKVTKRYLGIDQEDRDQVFMKIQL